jgi:hypothetical protein
MEVRLMRQTFADSIAICIFVCFVGMDNPSGRQGLHLVGDLVRRDGGHVLSVLSQNEAHPP